MITLLIAIPACYLAYSLGVALGPNQQDRSQKTPPPHSDKQDINGLVVNVTDLDVGEAWEDPEFVHRFVVRNTSNRALRVKQMHGGCECKSVAPQAFTIPPGGEQQVEAKIDLTHRFPHQFGVDRRDLAVSVYPVFVNRGVSAAGWTIRGVVKSRVSVDGRELSFGDLCGQGGPPVTRAMKATAHVPLARLEATAPAKMATVNVVPAPQRRGGYDIRVTPNPDLPLGPFRFEVGLTATTPDGERHRCVAFQVEGEMRSGARVIPAPVLLGEHATATTAEAVVSLSFPAPGWRVDRVEMESSDTAVTAAPLLGNHPTYRIAQVIAKPGDGSCQVRFVCRKPGGQLETISTTVRWYGDRAPLKEDAP